MHPVNCKLRLRFGQAALILLLLIPGARPAWAQFSGNIDIRFTASGDELTVGDPVTLTLAATYPAGYDIAIPSLPNSWGDFDVRRQSEPETTLDPDGVKTTRQTIEVTLFAPGTFQTPSWSVTLRGQNGETVERAVPQVSLTVLSVLQEGDADLKDIKPQAELPLPPLWPWLAGGLLLAALLAWAARQLYRRLKGRRVDVPLPAAPAADPRPPHEIALAELARIERLDLPGQGRFKEHYTLVGDCLRRYLEGRYHIPALDMTTTQTRLALKKAPVSRENAGKFITLFITGDLVKFARLVPALDDARQLVGRGRDIVQLTRPRLPEPEPVAEAVV